MSDHDEEALRRWEEADELCAQMQTCPGWDIWHDLRSVEDTTKVFRGNDHELKTAAAITEDWGRWLPLVSTDNREGYARYMDEMDRLFHNYLASAYSLSCCMWKLYERRGWAALPEGAEYLRRAPKTRPGLTAFMFGLRHVAQHQRIPLTTSGEKGWRDDAGEMVMESYFLINLDVLKALDWSRDAAGFAHLQTLTDDPRLDELVPAFTTELLQFVAWFASEFRRVYRKELKALDEMHLRHATLMQPFYDANRS